MNLVAVLFVVCCIALILIILIQKGRGGGLSSAFGGGGAGGVLGSKTGDFLTWVTIILVGIFLLLAVIMAKFYRPGEAELGQDAAQTETQQGAPIDPGMSDANAIMPVSDTNALPAEPTDANANVNE